VGWTLAAMSLADDESCAIFRGASAADG